MDESLLGTLINVPAGIGYPLLFGFVAAESAGGLVPGETSLILAAALAAQGQLSLPVVIAVAAGAAILGDNVGYVIGRSALRRLVDRPGHWAAERRRLVESGEEFFARRGSAAVIFGRWLPGMRVATSWLAGADRMPWRRFSGTPSAGSRGRPRSARSPTCSAEAHRARWVRSALSGSASPQSSTSSRGCAAGSSCGLGNRQRTGT
jgi:membrane protein DedA with SNARE-associated domain